MNMPVFLLLVVVLPLSLIVITLGVYLIARPFLSGGSARTGLRASKGLVGAEQMLAARWFAIPERLSGPVDLDGSRLHAAVAANPLIAQIAAVIGVVQLARVAASAGPPRQLVSERLAQAWGGVLKLPLGQIAIMELHARPLAADQMLVWFTAQIGLGKPRTEYWTFVSTAAAPSLPATCPNCGALTTGNTSGVCAYCHVALRSTPAPTPEALAFWLVDDIRMTPPAAAAA